MQRVYCPRNSNRRPIVEDLREKLNRIKQEKALQSEVGTKNLPPPDPAYNFLKDPLRDDNYANSSKDKKVRNTYKNIKAEAKYKIKCNDAEQKNPSKLIEQSAQENLSANSDSRRELPKEWQRQNWKIHATQNGQQPRKFKEGDVLQHPINNIKVEVSSISGERKCTFDDTAMVQIPLTSKNYTDKSKSEKWSQRGQQNYYAAKSKQKSSGKSCQTNEGDTDKQLKTGQLNKSGKSPDENYQKTESIGNEAKTRSVIVNESKEKSELVNISRNERVHRIKQKRDTKTLKNNKVTKNENTAGRAVENEHTTDFTANKNESESVTINETKGKANIVNSGGNEAGKENKQLRDTETFKNVEVKKNGNSSVTADENNYTKEFIVNKNESEFISLNERKGKAEIVNNNGNETENLKQTNTDTEILKNNDNESTTVNDTNQKASHE